MRWSGEVFSALNAALAILVLRLFLPRILAISSMQDLGEFGKEMGLPTRDELQGSRALPNCSYVQRHPSVSCIEVSSDIQVPGESTFLANT